MVGFWGISRSWSVVNNWGRGISRGGMGNMVNWGRMVDRENWGMVGNMMHWGRMMDRDYRSVMGYWVRNSVSKVWGMMTMR